MNQNAAIRIFDNRVEVEATVCFPGNIWPANIARAGSRPRNSLIAAHLREFPNPPNVDAGEDVPMMISQMKASGLFPPRYTLNTEASTGRCSLSLSGAPSSHPLSRARERGSAALDLGPAADRARLRAELDGLIAHLYSLSDAKFVHILGSFPLVAAPVKAAALAAFRELA